MNKNDVVSLKLTTGEEVIGRFDSENDSIIILNKPLSFVMAEQGLSLGPFMISANKDDKITISKLTVIAIIKTNELIAKQYLKQSTGLVL